MNLQLTEWAERQGLELLEFEEGRKACTIEVLAMAFKADTKVKTCELRGVAQGHRALSWFCESAITDWLGLRPKAQAWAKEQQRVAEAEALREADSRLLIETGSEAEALYVQALGDEPPEELAAMVDLIEALGLEEREQADALITKVEWLFNAACLAAAEHALPRKGRLSSRRAPEGWHPALGKGRLEFGQIDRLLTRLHQPDGWQKKIYI